MPFRIPESLMQQIRDFASENPEAKQQLSLVVQQQIDYLLKEQQGIYKSFKRFQKKFSAEDLGNAILAFLAGCTHDQLQELSETFENQILLITVETNDNRLEPAVAEPIKRTLSKTVRDPIELAFREIFKVLPLLMGAFSTFEVKQKLLRQEKSLQNNIKRYENHLTQQKQELALIPSRMQTASDAEKQALKKQKNTLTAEIDKIETELTTFKKSQSDLTTELNLCEQSHFNNFLRHYFHAKKTILIFTQLFHDSFADDDFIADFAAGLLGKLLYRRINGKDRQGRYGGLRIGDRRYMEVLLNKNEKLCQFLTEHLGSLTQANKAYLQFSNTSFQSSLIPLTLCEIYDPMLQEIDQDLIKIENSLKVLRPVPAQGSKWGRYFRSSSTAESPKWIVRLTTLLFDIRTQISKIALAAETIQPYRESSANQKEVFGLVTNAKKMMSIILEELKTLLNNPENDDQQIALQRMFEEINKKITVLEEQPTLLAYLYPLTKGAPQQQASDTSASTSSSATSTTSYTSLKK